MKRLMTSHSKGAPIYYMDVQVAFKKNKRVLERSMWVVSVFDNPSDIMSYDLKTMSRLRAELYPKSKKERQVMVREILSKKFISNSQISKDEHKRQNIKEV